MEINEITPCLWHAFHSLDGHQTGNGLKAQLKVLAFNVANCFGVKVQDEVLDKYKEQDSVTFDNFCQFIQSEILNQIDENENQKETKLSDLLMVNDACWLICQKLYIDFRTGRKLLSRNDIYKLWCVFNFVSEPDEHDKAIIPIIAHRNEVELIMNKMQTAIGKVFDRDVFEEASKDIEEDGFLFEQFVELIEHTCFDSLDKEAASCTICDIYEEYILQVAKKGLLGKKAPSKFNKINPWSERWFVLTPLTLQYFANRDEKDRKGTIEITQNCRAGEYSIVDKSRPHRFQVVTGDRTYELSAPDKETKTKWLTLLNAAIDESTKPYKKQRYAWLQRYKERKHSRELKCKGDEETKEKERKMLEQQEALEAAARERQVLENFIEEELKKKNSIIARLQDIEQERTTLKEQLGEEETKRDAHQKRLEELSQEREKLRGDLENEISCHAAEKARSEELERNQTKLEERVQEEASAKRDEEIARNLVAIALREESAKREELERLREEQELQLREEQKKRKDLEEFKQEQQKLLEAERARLDQLSLDRERKEEELKAAREQISKAELATKEIEKRVKSDQNPHFRKLLTERIIQAIENPNDKINSHRGEGAFTKGEFDVRQKQQISRENSLKQLGSESESEIVGNSPLENETRRNENETSGGASGDVSAAAVVTESAGAAQDATTE